MTEQSVYQQEILRLKERVNTLIDVLEYAREHALDPFEWIDFYDEKLESLDKEELNKYNI